MTREDPCSNPASVPHNSSPIEMVITCIFIKAVRLTQWPDHSKHDMDLGFVSFKAFFLYIRTMLFCFLKN